jgi:hypothetical protein
MNNDKWKAVTSINTALHLSLFIIYTYVVYS